MINPACWPMGKGAEDGPHIWMDLNVAAGLRLVPTFSFFLPSFLFLFLGQHYGEGTPVQLAESRCLA